MEGLAGSAMRGFMLYGFRYRLRRRKGFLAHEVHPFARKGPNQSLFIAIVADCGPRRVHAAAGRCFQHDASVPDGLEEIVAAHHVVPGTNEEFQHIENLRLDRNQAAAAAKLLPVGIKDTILEPVEQDRSPVPML